MIKNATAPAAVALRSCFTVKILPEVAGSSQPIEIK
jgi:hypothetical protein